MGAVFSRGRASTENRAHRDASGRVATASVARDDLVSATDVESTGASGPAGPAIRTSKDLASWLAARDGAATLVRCEGALTPDVASSAEALGVDVESIVKSLVFAVDGAFVVVVTNGETKVDVKKLAARMGVANRRVRLATREETIDACGFVPGTVPPFGHKEKLRTFVDASVPTEVGAGAVFAAAAPDAEVRVESVDELLRLTDGELLDVKKRERGEALPEVVPAYDEREARREARGENERYPAAWRAAKARSIAEPRIVRAFAEVVRVRRVARFLVFATLRPLAEPTVEAPDAFDEAQRADARRFLAAGESGGDEAAAPASAPAPAAVGSPVSFPAEAEFQLIAGRSLVERIGEDAAERAFRDVKAGGVVEVVARTQANPRPRTVDLVARSVRVVRGARGDRPPRLRRLSGSERGNARDGRADRASPRLRVRASRCEGGGVGRRPRERRRRHGEFRVRRDPARYARKKKNGRRGRGHRGDREATRAPSRREQGGQDGAVSGFAPWRDALGG